MNFLRKILVEKSGNWFIQLFRYTLVGGTAFIVDFGLLYVLVEWCRMHYLAAATASFIAGLTVNYLLSMSWIFSSPKYENRMTEFMLFALTGVAGLGINELAMYLLTDVSELHYMLSKTVATAIVFIWNFTVRRALLFRSGERKQKRQ